MNPVIFPKLRGGNITIQEIGLLHYICGHLKDGVFDQPLPQIAIATNLSAPTIHRLLTRLTASGFLKVVRPTVKTKTGNTPVGYKPIQLVEWGAKSLPIKPIQLVEWGAKSLPIKPIPSEPIPNGMIHKESSISVKLVDGVESMLLDSMGIIPPVEWAPDQIIHRAVLLTLEAEERRRQEIERAADYVYTAWGRANRESRILAPMIQPKPLIIPPGAVLCMAEDCDQPRVKDGYCGDHQAIAAEAKNEAARERQQLTYEANKGLFDDKQQAAELKAIEQCNRLGLGFLEQGEEIGGKGPDSYEICSISGIVSLKGRTEIRRPLCDCGHRVDFILEHNGTRGTKFWSLGTCRNCRPKCACGQLAYVGLEKCDNDAGGYVQIAPSCVACMSGVNSPKGSQADYAQ
jgi:hypothetical protein